MADAPGDRLFKSTLALLTSSVSGAVLGLVFWAVAAHEYSAHSVGDGAAAIAAMTLLASLAQLNLSAMFPRFLYPSGARAMWVLLAGYAASALLAVAGAAVFLTLTGHHSYIGHGALPPILFAIAVVLWVVFTIEDAALIGLRATFWVPVENTSFSLVKIVLLPVLAATAPVTGVFYSWTLPVIACIIPVNIYLFGKILPAHVAASAGRGALPAPRVVGAVLGGEYLGSLSFIALTSLPALLVVARLGAVQTAYFQTPWLIGTSFELLLFGIATSLLAESSARPAAAPTLVPRAVRLGCLLLLPGCVLLLAGAPLILSVLGAGYASHGTSLLRWLALALPFMGVNTLYVTFARMGRRVRRIVAVQLGSAVFILVLMEWLIGSIGITGAGVAFTAGQALVSCIVLPSVVRQYRRDGMAPGFAPDGPLVVPSIDTAERVAAAPGDPPDDAVAVAPVARRTAGTPGRRWKLAVTALVLLLDLLALYAGVADVQGAPRMVVGLALILVVPGWSIVGLVRLSDPMLEIGLTVAVSLAACMVGAQLLLALHTWHLVALQEAVSIACIPLLMWQLILPPTNGPT